MSSDVDYERTIKIKNYLFIYLYIYIYIYLYLLLLQMFNGQKIEEDKCRLREDYTNKKG